jgi:hypothetical protein
VQVDTIMSHHFTQYNAKAIAKQGLSEISSFLTLFQHQDLFKSIEANFKDQHLPHNQYLGKIPVTGDWELRELAWG